jgi:hypothetical protein
VHGLQGLRRERLISRFTNRKKRSYLLYAF